MNRVFLPAAALDRWLQAGRVDIADFELVVRETGERFALEEAVRVLSQVTDGEDALRVVGRVRSVAELRQLGGELVERALVVGDSAYDVDPGFLAAPLGSSGPRDAAAILRSFENLESNRQMSDEELLAQYLARKLD